MAGRGGRGKSKPRGTARGTDEGSSSVAGINGQTDAAPDNGSLAAFVVAHERWVLVALFGIAVLWRSVYGLAIARSPFADDLSVDAAAHHDWARRIAGGDLTFGG
ncbi:MAG TPA: hypothetical protein VGG33_05615, partial [Polyangia bacterium]